MLKNKISDEALSKVAGGSWNYEKEEEFKAKYQSLKDRGVSNLPPYEEWIVKELAKCDAWALEHRQYWVEAGCPKTGSYM